MTNSPYIIRNYQPADFESYVLLCQEAKDLIPLGCSVSPQIVSEWLNWPGCSPEKDIFVVARDGNIVGGLDLRPELGISRVILRGWLKPEHRRKGLGKTLIDNAINRARELRARFAYIDINEDNDIARTAISKLGFSYVRRFLELKLDMSLLNWQKAKAAAQECRYFQCGEEAILTEIQNRSFAEHWGYNPNTVETITYSLNLSYCSPEDIILLCRQDKIIGFCWTEISGENKGRIYMIGSDPEYRGKGVGKKLLLAGLNRLNTKGIGTTVLTVDSGNKAALNLYKSVGFEIKKSIFSYEKAVT